MGYQAAIDDIMQIKAALADTDMAVIVVGLGGGTGTGAAPVIAQAARELDALTVGVATRPFYFEGKKRLQVAWDGLIEFQACADSVVVIPCDRLIQLAPKKATFVDMLHKADETLCTAVRGVTDLVLYNGLIGLDFADVQTVMSEPGYAIMGEGRAAGKSRARDAAMRAITSPLLEDISIGGARGLLIKICAGPDLVIEEVGEAAGIIQDAAHDDARIFFQALFDESMGDEMHITVIATGLDIVSIRSLASEKV